MYLNNRFYEIRSRKSEEYVNGVRQVSLSSETYDQVQCFLWLDSKSQLVHLQLLYDENVLEWFTGKGFVGGATNRRLNPVWKNGQNKGVRTIHETAHNDNTIQGIDILKDSYFPTPYAEIIKTILIS